MQLDLDNYFNETSERLFNRLIRVYNIRMISANDKEYSHKQFLKFCDAMLEFWFHLSDMDSVVGDLEHNYKLGKKFEAILKKVKKRLAFVKTVNNSIISDEPDEIEAINPEINSNDDFLNSENSSSPSPDIINFDKKKTEYSDEDIVRIYAKYKAYQRFREYLFSQLQAETQESNLAEIPERTKDFTTARQVLAVHYLLKYAQVKNVDKTEIARFIQFLTGKNYDNIYKKLQNPFKINDKYLKEDLRFIRDYFERLGMSEVVKMINEEMG